MNFNRVRFFLDMTRSKAVVRSACQKNQARNAYLMWRGWTYCIASSVLVVLQDGVTDRLCFSDPLSDTLERFHVIVCPSACPGSRGGSSPEHRQRISLGVTRQNHGACPATTRLVPCGGSGRDRVRFRSRASQPAAAGGAVGRAGPLALQSRASSRGTLCSVFSLCHSPKPSFP